MEAVKRQEAESKKSFCNSAAIEERFEDQVPEWMLSKPTVDCMIWPEEITQRESPIELEREDSSQRLSPRLITQERANVNIMSKRIADKIGLTKIQPSSISINYADSFSQTPMALCLM
ncbi:unnamed protein product [Microthlaspi erraticum]|uniref:Uncharacterized protein n=1 Tax=Microthlaspi erraticum TaxID=1685480 RepID=A0A6D2HW32_9BRAS|nr:unnamed protein product [Microthlaspi erraticum]